MTPQRNAWLTSWPVLDVAFQRLLVLGGSVATFSHYLCDVSRQDFTQESCAPLVPGQLWAPDKGGLRETRQAAEGQARLGRPLQRVNGGGGGV